MIVKSTPGVLYVHGELYSRQPPPTFCFLLAKRGRAEIFLYVYTRPAGLLRLPARRFSARARGCCLFLNIRKLQMTG
jgi:hypothetical protein